MNTLKHLLYSHNSDAPVVWFDKFNASDIKAAIVKHLTANTTDTIEHCKQYSNLDIKRFYGNEIINIYQYHNGKVCKLIIKGNKEYFKPIN